jgi:hypothetical protein
MSQADSPPDTDSANEQESGLGEDDHDWIRRVADSLGPLTDRQRDILGRLLRRRS